MYLLIPVIVKSRPTRGARARDFIEHYEKTILSGSTTGIMTIGNYIGAISIGRACRKITTVIIWWRIFML